MNDYESKIATTVKECGVGTMTCTAIFEPTICGQPFWLLRMPSRRDKIAMFDFSKGDNA